MRKIILSLLLVIAMSMMLVACTPQRTTTVKVSAQKQEISPVAAPSTNIQPKVEQAPVDTEPTTIAQPEEKPITNTVNAPIDDKTTRTLPISKQEIDSLKQGIQGITVDNPTGLSK